MTTPAQLIPQLSNDLVEKVSDAEGRDTESTVISSFGTRDSMKYIQAADIQSAISIMTLADALLNVFDLSAFVQSTGFEGAACRKT
jgi:hypothetical protein